MSQTQLASMFIGKPHILDELQGESKDINNLFILDKQDDRVLSHINKRYVIFNEHEQDLSTYRDMFRFTVLGDKPYAEYLVGRNGLIVPGEDGELLEFRIFESIKYRDYEGLKVEVYSLATYLDLKTAKVFDPQKTSAETAELHAKIALSGTEWQLGEVAFKGVRTLEFDSPFNSYDYLKRIARDFELELRFYITTDGQKVTGRYVDLVERVGEFRGRTVEFGRDLQRIERKENTDDIVTALWVYGPQREDGTCLKVFVEDDEARQRWGRRGQHIIDYYEPQTENQDITEERLKTLGEMELRKRINAVVTYEADIVDLENVPGMENKKIRFGDTIRIKDLKFNPALYLEARVFNQKRDVFNKADKTVQLGDYIEYTEDEVKANLNQLRQQIRDKISEAQLIEYTYSKEEIDTKDIEVKTSVEEYARTITDESKQEVIVYVDETIEPISVKVNELENEVDQAFTEISQAWDEINLKASQTDVNAIEGRLTTAEGQITTLAGQISLKADSAVVDELGQRVTSAEIAINGLEGAIELKVEANDVRSIFRQEADSFTFSASQINFEGHVFGKDATFNGKFYSIGNTGEVTIENGVIESSKNDYTVKIDEGRVTVFDVNSGEHASLYPRFLGVSNLNANEGINGGWGSFLTYDSLGFGDANKDYQGIMTSNNYDDLLIFNEIGDIKIVPNNDGKNQFVFTTRDSVDNAFIKTAGASLKFLANGTQIQARNSADTEYVNMTANEFVQPSKEKFKTDIHVWEQSALELIKNVTIYEYRLKSEVEKGIDRLHQGLVIGEGYNTPESLISGEGITLYAMNTWNMKAIQELNERLEQVEERLGIA